jgi:hypothetical protein
VCSRLVGALVCGGEHAATCIGAPNYHARFSLLPLLPPVRAFGIGQDLTEQGRWATLSLISIAYLKLLIYIYDCGN